MSEFQIGDVVKVTGNNFEYGTGTRHYFEDGVIATVKEGKDSSGDYYVINNDAAGYPTGQFVNEHNLERLPFQVGDKVRVTGNGDWENDRVVHYFDRGTPGEVTAERDFDGDYLVRATHDSGDIYEWYVHETHLEKVEETDEQNDSGTQERPCKYGGTCTKCDMPESEPASQDEPEEFEVGARVRIASSPDNITGIEVPPWMVGLTGTVLTTRGTDTRVRLDNGDEHTFEQGEVEKAHKDEDEANLTPDEDAVNSPAHYGGFSYGAEVIDITENLTSNGGQAVQYIARSTRLDGNNKGNVLEDLRKARWFIDREIERIENGG